MLVACEMECPHFFLHSFLFILSYCIVLDIFQGKAKSGPAVPARGLWRADVDYRIVPVRVETEKKKELEKTELKKTESMKKEEEEEEEEELVVEKEKMEMKREAEVEKSMVNQSRASGGHVLGNFPKYYDFNPIKERLTLFQLEKKKESTKELTKELTEEQARRRKEDHTLLEASIASLSFSTTSHRGANEAFMPYYMMLASRFPECTTPAEAIAALQASLAVDNVDSSDSSNSSNVSDSSDSSSVSSDVSWWTSVNSIAATQKKGKDETKKNKVTLLDVGCNTGALSLGLLRMLRTAWSKDCEVSLLGVDIDEELIARARMHAAEVHEGDEMIQFFVLDMCQEESLEVLQRILASLKGRMVVDDGSGGCGGGGGGSGGSGGGSGGSGSGGGSGADVTFVFGITMWIHLHHGDAGLIMFLTRLATCTLTTMVSYKNYYFFGLFWKIFFPF